MKEWLQKNGITHIDMESTGVYRKPEYNILEDGFKVIWSTQVISRMYRVEKPT